MRKSLGAAAVALLLLLIVGCSAAGPGESTLAVPTTATATVVELLVSPTDTAIPSPTETTTPWPSATSVPTRPPATATPGPARTPVSGTAPSGQVLASIQTIESEMEALRGLDGTSPVTRTLITREELTRYLTQEFEDDYPPQEVAVDTRVLAAFNFVPEEIDLRQILLNLYSEQVLGMYDEEVDTLFVVSDGEFDLMDRLTLAHEYVHGLQDQNFGLDSFIDDDQLNDDQYLARMALIEGDATLAMTQYLMAHLRELSAAELQSLQEEDSAGGQTALEAAPTVIRETLVFPYDQGTGFVTLLQERGWEAIDAAYADPPQSTEQILHPERYFERDEPQLISLPPLTDTLGIDWERIDSETLGEFQTTLYLAQEVDQATAEQASAGWDGDRYAVYGRGEDEVLALSTVWDSATDRDQFVTAYQQYATARYGRDPIGTDGDAIWWQTPSQTTALSWLAEQTFVVVGPDLATVERVLAALAP